MKCNGKICIVASQELTLTVWVQVLWAFEGRTHLQLGVEFPLFSCNPGAEAFRARPCLLATESRKGCKQTATKRDGGNGTIISRLHHFHAVEMWFILCQLREINKAQGFLVVCPVT